MKRDMELVRALLLAVEDEGSFAQTLKIEGYDDVTVGHHVVLMMEAGLMTGDDVTSHGDTHEIALPGRLTWAGHDALAAIRNDTVWNKTKDAAAKVGGVTMPILLEMAARYLRQQLGLPQ